MVRSASHTDDALLPRNIILLLPLVSISLNGRRKITRFVFLPCSWMTKGALCGPVDTHLADAGALTEHRKCHVLVTRSNAACPRHGPRATCILLSSRSGGRMGTCQLRGKALIEIYGSYKMTGAWRSADNPTQENNVSRIPKCRRVRLHAGLWSQ
jgi:hypothetical protein